MKRLGITFLPILFLVSACQGGGVGLSEAEQGIMESVLSGSDSQLTPGATGSKTNPSGEDGASVAGDDGSRSVDPGSLAQQGPITATPAFPGQNNDNSHPVEPVGQGQWQFQKAHQAPQVHQDFPIQGYADDENSNNGTSLAPIGQGQWQVQEGGQFQQVPKDFPIQGYANDNSGYQAEGSRPVLTVAPALQVYDPFCNCYRTEANPGNPSGFVKASDIPKVEGAVPPVLAGTGNSEDEDDSDD